MTSTSPKTELTKEQEKEIRTLVLETFVRDRLSLVSSYPFYGMLLLELEPIVSFNERPLAAVNLRNIFLSGHEDFRYDKLDPHLRLLILTHEVLHLVFQHCNIPNSFNRTISNIAMDACIHRVLLNSKDAIGEYIARLPEGTVQPIKAPSPKFHLPQPNTIQPVFVGFTYAGNSYHIKGFDLKDWDLIYWDLLKIFKEEAKQYGQSLEDYLDKLSKKDPMSDDVQTDETFTDSDHTLFRFKVLQAYDKSKQFGRTPAFITDYIDRLRQSEIPWTQYLSNFIRTEISNDDFKQAFTPRRAHFSDFTRPPIYPKVESEALGHVFCVLDTSGSMSEEELSQGLSEFKAMRQVIPFHLHFVCCDAQVYEVSSFSPQEEPNWMELAIVGRGGTDFRPVFKLVNQFSKDKGVNIAALVYFTDTMGSFPDSAPTYPVLWVTSYDNPSVPWGKLISTR